MKKFVKKILTGSIAAVLAGCTSSASAASASPAASSASSAAQSTDSKLTVYMPSPSGLNKKYIEQFQKETGITVDLFEGTTGEISARLEAEAANPVADVVVLASWADGLRYKEKGMLQSYAGASNKDKLKDGYVDADSMLFGTSASALGVIYNTKLISSLNADWNELADAAYKDQLTVPDPTKSGSCKDFLAGYMSAYGDEGWSTWQKLADNGMTVSGANKAALESVTTGEKAILVAGVDYNAYSSIAQGEPLAIYYPASGTVINPRPAMILKTSAHAANAQKFIDYLMSDEAQKLVANAYLLPGRTDIKCDSRANYSDIKEFKYDWSWMVDHGKEVAEKFNALSSK